MPFGFNFPFPFPLLLLLPSCCLAALIREPDREEWPFLSCLLSECDVLFARALFSRSFKKVLSPCV